MNISIGKIIQDHNQVRRQKDRPIRLVEVWANSEPPYISSLVVTAFDLYSSLFGDCAYSMFSEMKETRSMNVFQISNDRYRDLTRRIKQYLTVKKCSARSAFRDVTTKGLELLSELAYEITASRVWTVKQRSLDPVYNPYRPPPFPEIGIEVTAEGRPPLAVVYFQILSVYLIKDVIGIILMYSIDPCLPNHVRCSGENKDGTRCNRLRAVPSGSCLDHTNSPYFLSNHYFV